MGKANIKPVGEFILIELVSPDEEITKGGIIKPLTEERKADKMAIIKATGPKVESRDFKIGDYVVINDYDVKKVPLDRHEYALIKASSVFATYEYI